MNTKYGKMVLWMGLILMALQIAAEWTFIRKTIFTPSPTSGSGGGGLPLAPLPPLPFPFSVRTPPGSRINVGNQFPTIRPPNPNGQRAPVI